MPQSEYTPVSDEAFDEIRRQMKENRNEIREALTEDLGGDPEDYLQRDE